MKLPTTAISILVIVVAQTANFSLAQDDEFRVWTSKDGTKKIEAKLLSVDSSKKSVTLVRRNGKPFTTLRENLSVDDQRYLDKTQPPPRAQGREAER